MCLAVPMRILSIKGDVAEVDHGGVRLKASLMIIDEPCRVGDYVIVHAGFAIHLVDPQTAAESLELLHQLAASIPVAEGN